MRFRDYSVHIFVDGKQLEEYNVVKESPTRVTCWIASEEGKNFALEWTRHEHKKKKGQKRKGQKKKGRLTDIDVAATLIIDGIECGYTLTLDPGESMDISSICSDTGERDLVFSRLNVTDEDVDNVLDDEVRDELGEIRFNLYHGTRIDCVPEPRPDITVAGGSNKIHETCKKAANHCVGLGPEREEAHLRPTSDWVVEPGDDPAELDLVFKYRSLAVLRANGIAPRPPPSDREGSVNESQNDSEHSDIKPDDVDDRIRILENELKRLHDMKVSTSEARKRKRVKQDSEPRKRSLFVPGEIIDLT